MATDKQLHVGCSPLTGTIFAGHVLKDGQTWAANKQDVTVDALFAVAQHVEQFGRPVILSVGVGEEAKPRYEITVRRLDETV